MAEWRRRHVVTTVAAIGGLGLFAYAVTEAGFHQILDYVASVGWGLIPILVLAGVRFVLRAEAWRLCTPIGSRLTLPRAFAAFLAGDALGNVTPFGMVASEPTKVFLTRHHLATRESIASLAVDTVVYTLSVAAMVSAGLLVMVTTVPLSLRAREMSLVVILVVMVGALGGLRLLGRRQGQDGHLSPGWAGRLTGVWQSVLDLSAGHPARLWRAFAFHLLFHGVAILETFLALRWLLGDRSPTLAEAVMFESLNRVITAVFKLVPLRVGVDEAASGAFATLLGISPAHGVALAVVRKVRSLFWVAVGLTIFAAHHVGRPEAQKRAPATGHQAGRPAHAASAVPVAQAAPGTARLTQRLRDDLRAQERAVGNQDGAFV